MSVNHVEGEQKSVQLAREDAQANGVTSETRMTKGWHAREQSCIQFTCCHVHITERTHLCTPISSSELTSYSLCKFTGGYAVR